MSAGTYLNVGYESDSDTVFPIRIQPETASFELNGVANTPAGAPSLPGLPSAQVSKGRRSHGVNTRLIRFRFLSITPSGYSPNSVLTLPIMTPSAYAAYDKNQTGTYTLLGTAYDVGYVGKTPEKIN